LQKLICGHLSWDPKNADASVAKELAANLHRQNIDLAHFHFGGTYEWRSNRLNNCPVYHLARRGVPCLSTNHLVMEWLNCGVHPRRALGYKWLAQTYALLSRAQVLSSFETGSLRFAARIASGLAGCFRYSGTRSASFITRCCQPMRRRRIMSERKPVILCIGTIGGRKAQPNLVESFANIANKHPEWQLEIIGRVGVVEDFEKIQHTVVSRGLTQRVHLPGRLSDEETVARMQTSSIIAIPSLQEGLGLSLQEALFYGCVGVGSRAGGIPELIEHEVNGLLVRRVTLEP